MAKKDKVIIGICIPLAIICFVLFVIGNSMAAAIPETLVIPSGKLTNDLFARQNMSYTAVDGMSENYLFANMPYRVDVAEGQTAHVEGADILYHAPYYFYYNVVPTQDDTILFFKEQIAGVLMPQKDTSELSIEVILTEEGNYNGCYGNYQVLHIKTKDSLEYYMFLYRMHVDESFYVSENDMVVGCMTSQITSEGLASAQSLALSTFGTLTFDKERAKMLEEEEVEEE